MGKPVIVLTVQIYGGAVLGAGPGYDTPILCGHSFPDLELDLVLRVTLQSLSQHFLEEAREVMPSLCH